MVTEEQKNRSERNPTTISIHRCYPLTCRTRGKEIIKKNKQKQRKKYREKVQKNKRNARN